MQIDTSLLNKYNKPGPRYTSYPPANFFTTTVNSNDFKEKLLQSNVTEPQDLSLYVHVPFCPKLCNFCGCNTQILRKDEHVKEYFDALETEIYNVAKQLDKSRQVKQIHWGGGTPNAVPMEYVHEIMELFRSLFNIDTNAEIAMECNPAYMDEAQIKALANSGFNRISIGVQDFDPEILKIINRDPSLLPIEETTALLRKYGIKSINFDFVYGLPGQTTESFCQSIERAMEMNPDRLVTFSYAHVPWVKKAQKILEKKHLPSAEEKIAMLVASAHLLNQNGYTSIGIDHYAKPTDELAIALEKKNLHRNFQGYCTRETTGQVYAFGCSSISQLSGGYFQNVKSAGEYIDKISAHGFATERGYILSLDEKVIRDIINEVMCNRYINFQSVADNFNITIAELYKIIGFSTEKLDNFISDELLSFSNNTLEVHQKGYYFVRNIAMIFDPQLKVAENTYSKTV